MGTPAQLEYVIGQLNKGPHIPDAKELAFISPSRKKYIEDLQAQGADQAQIWQIYRDSAKESMIEFTPAYTEAKAKQEAAAEAKLWEEYAGRTREIPGERTDIDDRIDQSVERLTARYEAEGMSPSEASAQANRAIRFPIHIWRTAEATPQATVGADPADPWETTGMTDWEILKEGLKPQKLPTGKHQAAQRDMSRVASNVKMDLASATIESMAQNSTIYQALLSLEVLGLHKRYTKEVVIPGTEMSKDEIIRYNTIRGMGFSVLEHEGKPYVQYKPRYGAETLPIDMSLIPNAVRELSDEPTYENDRLILSSINLGKAERDRLYSAWSVAKAQHGGIVREKHLDFARVGFQQEARDTIAFDAEQKGEKLTELELHKRSVSYGQSLYGAYEATLFPGVERARHDPSMEEHGAVTLGPLGTYQIPYDTAYTLKHVGLNRNERGELVETMMMAGLRDLGGLIRFATDPAIEAISYEVDENGNPVDKGDWNYQWAMAVNESLGNIAGGEGGFGDYAVATQAYWTPSFVREPSESPHRRRASTGNYVRDVAISIARGRTLVDDFNELGETTTVYANLGVDWVPTAAGIMTEVGLPITPLPFAKVPIAGGAGLTAVTIRLLGRGMGHVSRLVDSSGVSQKYLTAMGSTAARPFELVQSPTTWARQQLVYREALAAVKASDKKPAYPARVTLMDEAGSFVRGTETARLPRALANRMGSDMAGAYIRGVLRTPEGSKLNVITNLIVDADKLMTAAYRGGTKAWKALEESKLGREIKDAYVAARIAGYRNGTPQMRHRILSTIAEDALKGQLAHAIPNNWVLVTASVVVPIKAWKTHGKGVMKEARELLENTEFAQGTLYRNGKEVVDLLSETLGWTKINATPYWSTIRSKLLNKKSLTLKESNSVHNMAVSGILKREMTGSVKLEYAGPAFVKGGREAVGRGQGAFGVAAEVIKGVKTAGLTLFGAKPAKLQATGYAPIPVQKMLDSINVRMTRLDREFSGHVAAARRKNRDGFIDDLIEEFASDDVVGDLMSILGSFFGMKETGTWAKLDNWKIRKTLNEAGLDLQVITPDLIRRAIEVMRVKHPALVPGGIKSRGVVGRGLKAVGWKTDQPDLALFAWMLDGYKSKVLDELTAPFIKEHPELLVRAGGDDVADMQSARAILSNSNVPDVITNALLPIIYRGSGSGIGLSPSQFRHFIRVILSDLFDEGTMPVTSGNRFADIIMGRHTESQIMRISELRNKARAVVTRQVQSTLAPGAVANTAYVNRIAEDFVKTFVDSVIQASTDINLDRIIGQLRASGISIPRTSPHKLGESLKPQFLALRDDVSVLVNRGALTSLEIKAADGLLRSSASAKLWDGLERMRKSDAGLWEDVIYDVAAFVNWTRRMAIGGLLGGFPLPNGRYLGLNAFTAPFIAMVTTPAYVMTAFKTLLDPRTALRIGARTMEPVSQATLAAARKAFGRTSAGTSFFNWVHASVAKGADDVVMVDAWGRRWTKSRLQDSMNQHNIMYTQTAFEFREKVFDDLRRVASTNPNLKKAGWVKQTWRYLNPANKNIWSVLAENTDLAFREATYAEAIRRGLTENQASEIARNVLLDYGKLFPVERDLAAKGMLFYAFQRQMMVDVVRTLVDNPFGFNAIRAQVQLVKTLHEEAGTWMLEPDYARSRIWSWVGPTYDSHVNTNHYGPALPALESFNTLVNVAGASIDFVNMHQQSSERPDLDAPGLRKGWEGMDATYPWDIFFDRVTGTFREKYMATPGVSAILDITEVRGRFGEDVRTLDPRWALFFQNSGTWELAQDWFNIQKSTADPRVGKPTYQEGEWAMDAAGYKVFRAFQYLTLILGVERNIRDNMMIKMKSGETPPDWRFKYMAEGNPVLYSLSLDTTMAVPDEYMTEMKIINEIGKELDALQ